MADHSEKLDSTKPRVWLISFPRSGNTFLRNVLFRVYGISSTEFHLDSTLKQPSLDGFQVIKTHVHASDKPPIQQHDKVVLLVRDGRDCMVSIAHHKKDFITPDSHIEQNMEEAILAARGSFFGGWSSNIDSWIDRADIIMRFENLIENPITVTERLRAILDLPQPKVDELPTFQSLKHGGDDTAYGKGELRNPVEEASPEQLTSKFFRRGIAGAWQDEMPSGLQQLFWNKHADMMLRLGYQRDGSISMAYSNTDDVIANRLGISNITSPKRILMEASKLAEQGNDGIKRYVLELVHQFFKLDFSHSGWHIDLYVRGEIVSLEKLQQAKRKSYYESTSDGFTQTERLLYGLLAESKKPESSVVSMGSNGSISLPDERLVQPGKSALQVVKDMLPTGLKQFLRAGLNRLREFRSNAFAWTNRIMHYVRKVRALMAHSLSRLFSSDRTSSLSTEKPDGRDIDNALDYDLLFLTLPQHAVFFKAPRIPVVTTIHDFTHITHPQYHTRENILNTEVGLEMIRKNPLSYLISISDHTTGDIHKYFSKQLPLKRIYEAANPASFHLTTNAEDMLRAQKKYGINAQRYVVTLSTIEPRKNLINAVRGFNHYLKQSGDPITQMVIIGKQGWGKQDFKQIEREIQVNAERFVLTGFVADDDLPLLLTSARVMCYVSLYEGFGLPILEAYRCGLPVICGANSSQTEVGGPKGLYVDPLAPHEIAKMLDLMINDDDAYQAQRSYCIDHANTFSWYGAAHQTLKFFANIIDQFQSKESGRN